MIHDNKQNFANKYLYDHIVKYGIVCIHVRNWTHIESNTSMHGTKYTVKSACTQIYVLADSFVMGPRFCIIVQKCYKFHKVWRHAEWVEIISPSIVVDVDCHPVFFGFVVWIRIAGVQRCRRCRNWQFVSRVYSSKSVSGSRIGLKDVLDHQFVHVYAVKS